MEPQLETQCWTTASKPCTVDECPYHILFDESFNCSRRVNRGLSQAEVGRALGLTRARVGQLEKSARSKVHRYFSHISAKDLLPLTETADAWEPYQISDAISGRQHLSHTPH